MEYLFVKLIATAVVAFFCSMVILYASDSSDNPYLERLGLFMLWVAGALVATAMLHFIWF